MMLLAEAYTEATRRLMEIADQLAKNPDDPDWITAALRDTLAVLEHLGGLEPSQQVRAQLHRLFTDLKAKGTITPDKIREIAQACGHIAQNNAQMGAQWNTLWP
ncbi:hypothetical protein [Mycolicibacterium conceptionense]|uniref:hypothetical protein n=1 Tax=Mycolicibacterium conceptionense TaxID=451644 RepID=UPI00320475EC